MKLSATRDAMALKNNLKTQWVCPTPKVTIIPAGTHVMMPSVWTFNSGGYTDYHDVAIKLVKDTMAEDVLRMLEVKAMEILAKEGGKELRDQYLTSIKFYNNQCVFQYDD